MAPKAPLREDIIAAAARVFQSKGYHGATVEDVANELNMLKGSLYYYIQKKEDLLLAIVSKPIEELLNGCKEIAGRNLPIKKKVKECILFHTRVVSKHWSAISVYLQEMFGTTPTDSDSELARVQRLYREYQSIIIELINEGIEKKVFRSDLDTRIAVFGLMGMLNWTHKWFHPQGRHKMDQIGEIFISLFLEGMEAKPPV